MKRQPSKWVLCSAILLGLAVAAAWLHSYQGGWTRTWSKPQTMTGGRLVSSDGRFFVQSCHVNPDGLDGLSDRGPPKLEMPADFQVGINPQGDKTVVPIGDFPVPFADPPADEFIGLRAESAYKYAPNNTFWRTSTYEFCVRYWLVALIPIAMIGTQCYRWIRCRRDRNASRT